MNQLTKLFRRKRYFLFSATYKKAIKVDDNIVFESATESFTFTGKCFPTKVILCGHLVKEENATDIVILSLCELSKKDYERYLKP